MQIEKLSLNLDIRFSIDDVECFLDCFSFVVCLPPLRFNYFQGRENSIVVITLAGVSGGIQLEFHISFLYCAQQFSIARQEHQLLDERPHCDENLSKFPGLASVERDRDRSVSNRLYLSPLFNRVDEHGVKDCKIEVVDDDTWRLSSGLVDAWRGTGKKLALEMGSEFIDGEIDLGNGDVDFDEIEDMRIRGNLFYKLDKDSKEYEEYKFDFHRRKCAKNEKDRKEKKKEDSNIEAMPKKDQLKEVKKSVDRKMELIPQLGDSCVGKKQRSPTFNQLTAPYHEPFCLDIHVTKGSVRASIIHRATSKVVAVSHSISKDMKFDLGSTKNRDTCAAVGQVLAQRALADDIHNVVYTPRKGDRLEGKLQIVLKSIIDEGVDVKVKLKQTKARKNKIPPLSAQD